MTSIIAVASYHKPVILHCAFWVIMTRFQITFSSSNCITIAIIIITLITIINIIIIITINTHITII